MGALLDQYAARGIRFERLPGHQLRVLGTLTGGLRREVKERKPQILMALAAAAMLETTRRDRDDRRTCRQCKRFAADSSCRAADAGIRIPGAGPRHHPTPDQPGRCIGYLPRSGEADQRHGDERWPFLAVTAPTQERRK